jgi:hypothetical protein
MVDLERIFFSCPSFDQFPKTLGEVGAALDEQTSRKLIEIVKRYIARYGFMGVYDRLNGRSVSQIFAEYQPGDLNPIASGDTDGLHYELHEASPPESEEGGT